MFKLLVLICLYASSSIVSSQNCADTAALRTEYGFSNSVTTPVAASGLNYCSSLKTGTICCTAADINNLQVKTDALLQNLTATVITRDQYFKTANVNTLQRLQAAATNFATTVATYTALSPGTSADAQQIHQEILDSLQSILESTTDFATSYNANVAQTTLAAFQAARTTCVVQAVKLQAANWCLSCDPNAATKGYNSATNTLPFSAATCDKLKAACYPFVSTSSFQNGPLAAQGTIDTMNAFSALVARIQGGQTAQESDLTAIVYQGPPISDVPEGCTTQANCDFICNGLFSDGLIINRADLIAGGDTSDGSRILQKDEPRMLADRRLQSGTYAPADDEAGVTVTFQNDPGNTAKSGMLSFGSVLIGAVALLSSYLL